MSDDTSLLLVLGAGASSEFELPTGYELKSRIAGLLNIRFDDAGFRKITGDAQIYEAIKILTAQRRRFGSNLNELRQRCVLISEAMPQAESIDNFIDNHGEEERISTCAKLAIARSILSAEAHSSLSIDRSNVYNKIDFKRNEDTWFTHLFRKMVSNCRIDDLSKRLEKLVVVSFNYDRCFEHFLFNSIKNYYDVPDDKAEEVTRGLRVFHPYGVVGSLPWMNHTNHIDFGHDPSAVELVEIANDLRTFTEGTDPDSSEIIAIRDAIYASENIVFLGFAFHRLNLKLLFDGVEGRQVVNSRRVFATGYGLSKSDCDSISLELATGSRSLRDNVFLRRELKCVDLFREYSRALTL